MAGTIALCQAISPVSARPGRNIDAGTASQDLNHGIKGSVALESTSITIQRISFFDGDFCFVRTLLDEVT